MIKEGVVLVPVTSKGEMLFLPDRLGENNLKKERSTLSSMPRELAQGYQFIGGGLEAGETLAEAAHREGGEEIGLELDLAALEILPVGIPIDQINGMKESLFGVTIFRLVLSEQQEQFLRNNGAIDSYLLHDEEIRPRDRIVRSLYTLVQERVEVV